MWWQADLTQTLKPLGLRMLTYTALVLIVENPGLSQSQLAAAMDVERPNLVEIIDELEQRALVLRRRVPADRRIYALTATPEGIQLCQRHWRQTRRMRHGCSKKYRHRRLRR